tara:strand:+ start:65 stop:913 length:849 start_codon:yes stop_codon:yes gene_type:complete
MKKLIYTILVITFILPKQSIAQNDDAWGAALLTGVGILVAIEKNKEVLENLAANYVMENYSQYKEFNLKVIGIGGGGKKMSGEGTVSLVPFSFTELKNGETTDNRKIILLFASRGWMNKFGVDYTKLRWEMWDAEKWNKLISIYSQLNSPIKTNITNGLFPEYIKKRTPTNSKSINSKAITIKRPEKYVTYELNPTLKYNSIEDVNIASNGLRLNKNIVFPFYSLDGDDYLVTDFNSEMKIFANENSLGIFLNETFDSILISRILLNKVHNFINGREILFEK